MRQYLEIKVRGKTRRIGFIDFEYSTFFTTRRKKNLFRSYYGFGISVPVLDYLIDEGIRWISVRYAKHLYKVSTSLFYIKGFGFDDKGDIQIILPMAYFHNDLPKFSYQNLQYTNQLNQIGSIV